MKFFHENLKSLKICVCQKNVVHKQCQNNKRDLIYWVEAEVETKQRFNT